MEPSREIKVMRPGPDVSSTKIQAPALSQSVPATAIATLPTAEWVQTQSEISLPPTAPTAPLPPPVSGPKSQQSWRDKEDSSKLKLRIGSLRRIHMLALGVLFACLFGFLMFGMSSRPSKDSGTWQIEARTGTSFAPPNQIKQQDQKVGMEQVKMGKSDKLQKGQKNENWVADMLVSAETAGNSGHKNKRARRRIIQSSITNAASSAQAHQVPPTPAPAPANLAETPLLKHFVSDADTWGYLTREQALTRFHQDGWKYVYYVAKRDFPTYVDFMSQVGQEYLILNYILPADQYRYNGTFVDMASNDAVGDSNSYALEKYFGWTGICIEPNPAYWRRYVHSARTCKLLNAAVGQTRNQDFGFVFREGIGGLLGDEFDNHPVVFGSAMFEGKRIPLQTVPLNEILDDMNMPSVITYLSLDVEGAESLILNDDFNFGKYTFWIITVERPKVDLQKRLERHGYVYVRDCGVFGDRMYVHKTIPSFDEIIKEFGPQSSHPARVRNCKEFPAKAGIAKSMLYNVTFDDVLSWKRLAVFVGTTATLLQEEDERMGKTLTQKRETMNPADKFVYNILGGSKEGFLVDIDPIHNSVGEMLEKQNGWKSLCIHNPDEENAFVNEQYRLSFSWRVAYRSCDLVLYDESLPPLDGLVEKVYVSDTTGNVKGRKESKAETLKIHLLTLGNEIKVGLLPLVRKTKVDMILIRSSRMETAALEKKFSGYRNVLFFCKPLRGDFASSKFPTGAGGRPVLLIRKDYIQQKNINPKKDQGLCQQRFWKF